MGSTVRDSVGGVEDWRAEIRSPLVVPRSSQWPSVRLPPGITEEPYWHFWHVNQGEGD
jgi:hypothetical protein